MSGSKVRCAASHIFFLPVVSSLSLDVLHSTRVSSSFLQALRSKATELVNAQLAAHDASVAAAPGGFAASISCMAAAIPRR